MLAMKRVLKNILEGNLLSKRGKNSCVNGGVKNCNPRVRKNILEGNFLSLRKNKLCVGGVKLSFHGCEKAFHKVIF